MSMDVIDFEIFGESMQYVEVALDPGEAVVGEVGAMYFMEDGITMETVFGDSTLNSAGSAERRVGTDKRLLADGPVFTTLFANQAREPRKVAFAASHPGKIVALHLLELGGSLIAQPDRFLCAAKGVSLGLALQQHLGGLFGEEGFILQQLHGDGYVFLHAGGTLVQRRLNRGETLRADPARVVAYQPSVSLDIEYVAQVRRAHADGDGLFFAHLRGPGTVWLQSLPLSPMADRVIAATPLAGRAAGQRDSHPG